jgi:hypothetical protein
MYRHREQEASPKLVGTPLEPARSVQAPIVVMMRLNNGRRKGRVACLPCMLQRNVKEARIANREQLAKSGDPR